MEALAPKGSIEIAGRADREYPVRTQVAVLGAAMTWDGAWRLCWEQTQARARRAFFAGPACRAAASAWSIFSPAMLPERSRTIVTSRRSVSTRFGFGADAIIRK